MDAAFIEQNQIIERYLTGKLPPKGAQDFERWCRANPDTVTRLGLSERINAALRLLDASGEPAPWAEKPVPFWQKLPVIAGLAAATVVLLVATILLASSAREQSALVTAKERELRDLPIQAVQATRPIIVEPSRNGPLDRSLVTIGGERVELADFKIDLSWSKFSNFRVTIDRVDQGRVAVLTPLARDSNGHLRIGLNSSALGPGDYQISIEGLDWRGNASPEAWARFTAAR